MVQHSYSDQTGKFPISNCCIKTLWHKYYPCYAIPNWQTQFGMHDKSLSTPLCPNLECSNDLKAVLQNTTLNIIWYHIQNTG